MITVLLAPDAITLAHGSWTNNAKIPQLFAAIAQETGALVARDGDGLVTESEEHSSDNGLALWRLCAGLDDLGYEVRVKRSPGWPRNTPK